MISAASSFAWGPLSSCCLSSTSTSQTEHCHLLAGTAVTPPGIGRRSKNKVYSCLLFIIIKSHYKTVFYGFFFQKSSKILTFNNNCHILICSLPWMFCFSSVFRPIYQKSVHSNLAVQMFTAISSRRHLPWNQTLKKKKTKQPCFIAGGPQSSPTRPTTQPGFLSYPEDTGFQLGGVYRSLPGRTENPSWIADLAGLGWWPLSRPLKLLLFCFPFITLNILKSQTLN